MLRELIGTAPDRRDLSQKKSHYLASLAVRFLGRDDPRTALAFLDYADRSIDRSHLTSFLLGERADLSGQTEAVLKARRAREGKSRRFGLSEPGDAYACIRSPATPPA